MAKYTTAVWIVASEHSCVVEGKETVRACCPYLWARCVGGGWECRLFSSRLEQLASADPMRCPQCVSKMHKIEDMPEPVKARDNTPSEFEVAQSGQSDAVDVEPTLAQPAAVVAEKLD